MTHSSSSTLRPPKRSASTYPQLCSPAPTRSSNNQGLLHRMLLHLLRSAYGTSRTSGGVRRESAKWEKRTLMRSRGAFRSRCRPRARARREQDRGPRLRSGGRSAGRSRPRLRWRVSHLAWRVSGRGGGSSCWASRCSHRGAHAERCGTRRSRDGPTLIGECEHAPIVAQTRSKSGYKSS